MERYLHSKWTSIDKIFGWRHYQVKNILKKKNKIELFAVCDKSINFVIEINELKDQRKWIPGWKEIV